MLLAFLLVGAYAVVILRCWYAWKQLPEPRLSTDTPPAFFSVIIPVRNEAQNIISLLQDLERQQYPASHYEVIVVDDLSEDATSELVSQFQAQTRMPLTLLFLADFSGKRQKKAAVETGIQHAKGEWIACTDGDCRLSPQWLQTFNQIKQDQSPKMISGPVAYAPTQTLWQQLQALEFSALIGVGAASIAVQKPTMCNGANLAYEKAAFYEVNGFKGNEQVPSGDDEFLLHKIHQKYPGQIAFAKSSQAVVQTPAAATITQFLHQRVRWASKWKHYESLSSQALALVVLGANVAVLVVLLGAVFNYCSWGLLGIVLTTKIVPDALLLQQVLGLFGKKRLLSLLWFLQLVYVPYILITAFLGLRGKYQWKGRELRTA
ncbi:glycosyltransferase family 2 protein [Rufibacter hautae]|uniref:Glycosyltransferase n=1 Tax=Rufibacter hautae TaxID=2595005 RepID=A0A5B6TFB5_9BACT|nr:glycosyltransferase [Rufibacter hautae]KAA3437912.1 glycosyltransferase [Rufibacter hautae]